MGYDSGRRFGASSNNQHHSGASSNRQRRSGASFSNERPASTSPTARKGKRPHYKGDAPESVRQEAARRKRAKKLATEIAREAEAAGPQAAKAVSGGQAMSGSVADNLSEPMRLQKFLARSGVASRRACEEIILAGRVCVNGQPAVELGVKVNPLDDVITLDGQVVTLAIQTVVLILNKPLNCVTTMIDPQGRPCVASMVPTDTYPSLFPIGRLDRNTSGLLLFSTDGQLGHGMLHPKFHVEKRYIAQIPAGMTERELQTLRDGVELNDGLTSPAKASLISWQDLGLKRSQTSINPKIPDTQLLDLRIKEGRKRQVRRMCDAVGFPVIALHRYSFGPLDLGELKLGEHRVLDASECAALRKIAGTD